MLSYELRNLFSLPNIIKTIRSKRMQWLACSTHGDVRNAYIKLLRNLKGRDTADERIISK
jgi:hypothetical protein